MGQMVIGKIKFSRWEWSGCLSLLYNNNTLNYIDVYMCVLLQLSVIKTQNFNLEYNKETKILGFNILHEVGFLLLFHFEVE